MVNALNGIALDYYSALKKEQYPNILNRMDEAWEPYAKYNMPVIKC